MDPDDIEFIAEDSTIGIIPNFSGEAIHFIWGSIQPFRAGIPVHVPLWFAIHLRKQQKCILVPPEWMDVDTLEEIKEEEKRSKFFTKMPSEHYMVEAKLIFGTAPADVPRSEDIRTAIKDIWDIRAAKLRTSMDDFIKGEGTYAKLDHLTIMEIHSVRPLLPHSLDLIARLERECHSFSQHNASSSIGGTHSTANQSTTNFSFNTPTW